MSVSARLRSGAVRLVGSDDPDSLAGRARARRWEEFAKRFPEIGEMHVVDLGGTPRFWRAAPVQPARVSVINLLPEVADESWIDSRAGDALDALEEHFDIAFSNSLIEHLPLETRTRFAENVERSAALHWVQTPNRHFPIEPHWLFPGVQYMPRSARGWLARNWPASNFVGIPEEVVAAEVANIELLTAGQLAELFPGSKIWHERIGPLTKSLVAIRDQ